MPGMDNRGGLNNQPAAPNRHRRQRLLGKNGITNPHLVLADLIKNLPSRPVARPRFSTYYHPLQP